MTTAFTSTVSERGQCVIPAPLRKRLKISSGEDLLFWINERGHLEAEPAHEARARAYKAFNVEASLIAAEIEGVLPEKESEELVRQQRR